MSFALIEEVKKREVLWNIHCEGHNDRNKTMAAWREISQELELEETIVRSKWKNLRDIFKKELKKVDDDGYYKGKWRCFRSMLFIKIEDNKKPDSNADETNSTEEYVEPEYSEENCVKNEPTNDSTRESYINFINNNQFDPLPDTRGPTNEDYDLMFLKSLAPYFKSLDPMRRLAVRSKMQDLLLNELADQKSSCTLRKAKKRKHFTHVNVQSNSDEELLVAGSRY